MVHPRFPRRPRRAALVPAWILGLACVLAAPGGALAASGGALAAPGVAQAAPGGAQAASGVAQAASGGALAASGAAPAKAPVPKDEGAGTGDRRECRDLLKAVRDDAVLGFTGGRSRIEMRMTRPGGSTRTRTAEVKSRRVDGRLEALVRFLSPSEVAGTALLLKERADGPDEQILWLPALGRSRRITGQARQGAFMGTDFSYADLEVRSADPRACRRLPDQTLEGQPVHVVETTGEADDAYGRARLYIHAELDVPLKAELYDRAGRLEKVMRVRRLDPVDGRWVATDTTLENVQRGSKTRLRVEEIDPDATFADDTFTERALSR